MRRVIAKFHPHHCTSFVILDCWIYWKALYAERFVSRRGAVYREVTEKDDSV